MLKDMGEKSKKYSKTSLERNPKSLLEIHPVELGQQLALLEAEIFQKITPLELMNQVRKDIKLLGIFGGVYCHY